MSPKRPFDTTTHADDAPPPKFRLTSTQNTSRGLAPTHTDIPTKTDETGRKDDLSSPFRTQFMASESYTTITLSSNPSNDHGQLLVSPIESFDPVQFAKPTSIPINRERMRKAWVPSTETRTLKPSPLKHMIKAANSFYHYRRLDSNQVRLLVIKPAPNTPSDPLNTTLMTLDDEQLKSKECTYAALSYNWGDSSADHTMIIQDDVKSQPITSLQDLVDGAMSHKGLRSKQLLIRPNLHEALKQLRRASKDKHLYIWVDAICINQNDEVEKQEQVMKMAQIYRGAKNVCIWLGSDESENNVSDMAMKFIPEAIQPSIHYALLREEKYIPKWASLFELLRWSW
jgi:hypothetical protein